MKRKIGIALGGGAARGWAHLGVLQALAERKAEIEYIAGTSIGALVGAFFAVGKLSVLEEMAVSFSKRKALGFFDLSWSREGFVAGRKVNQFMRECFGRQRIEDLPIPFAAVAVDVRNGEEVVIRQGDLVQAVRASISIPGFFSPVRIGDALLVDGGMADPLPVGPVRQLGADWVIGVDLNWQTVLAAEERKKQAGRLTHRNKNWFARHRLFASSRSGWWKIAVSSMMVMQKQLTEARLRIEPCELLIRPEIGAISTFDFHRSMAGVEAGRQAGRKASIKL